MLSYLLAFPRVATINGITALPHTLLSFKKKKAIICGMDQGKELQCDTLFYLEYPHFLLVFIPSGYTQRSPAVFT